MEHLKTSKIFHKTSSEEMAKKSTVLNPSNVKRIVKDQAKAIAQFVNDETKRIFGEIGPIEEIL